MILISIYLWQGTIVPDITLVRETITNKAHFALLDILLEGIEGFASGNLLEKNNMS